ncbi:hypothetical protein NFI96_032052, partial [Prochilodus magdalenae]
DKTFPCLLTASPRPTLTVHPESPVFTGESVTLKCEINPHGGWTYQWYKQSKQGKWAAVYQSENYTVNRDTVTIRGDAVTDGDQYYCKVKRPDNPSSTQISNTVTLTVQGKLKPELTSSHKGAALIGSPVVLHCKLNQSARWKFYWSKHTQNPENETETETPSYTISSVSVSDRGEYWCRAGRGDPVYYTHYSDALWINTTGESPPVSLMVSLNRTQHFTTDPLSLSCEGQSDFTGWRVRRYTHSEKVSDCSSRWRSTSATGSTCSISSLSPSHTGLYWCESESGESSNPVNITVHNGPVIVESPVHPVTEGDPLTLRCLYRHTNSSNLTAEFYKDGSLLQTQTTGEMTIRTVSKSDEGLYHCKHPEGRESPQTWISVRVSSPPPVKYTFGQVVVVVLGVSVAVLFIILLILLWHYQTNKGNQQNNNQTADQNQRESGGTDAENEHSDVTYSQVKTKNKKPRNKSNSVTTGVCLRANCTMTPCLCTLYSVQGDPADEPSDVTYSQVKIKNKKSRNKSAGTMDVHYAEIELKAKRKPKGKREKTGVTDDTVYSELKQGTRKGWYKPVLSVQPKRQQIFSGETVTLTCSIPGRRVDNWTYYWYRDNTQLHHSDQNYYTITDIKVSQSSNYYCYGSVKHGRESSGWSNAVTLTVTGTCLICHSCNINTVSYDYWKRLKASLTMVPTGQMFSGETVTLRCDIQGPQTLGGATAGESPPVSLIVSPSRTQHFTIGSLSLSCEGQSDSTGWRVRRYTHSKVSDCLSGWRSVTGSTCSISSLSTSHTGVYWCESESGGSSDPVNITVHCFLYFTYTVQRMFSFFSVLDNNVILESPVHPVPEGDPLTLHCLYRYTNSSNLTAEFYKDGSLLLQTQTTGEMTIRTVSKSDEGLYHCKHPERGESPQSWISVRCVFVSGASFSVLSLLSSLMAASPYLLVSIGLGVKCYRARAQTDEDKMPKRCFCVGRPKASLTMVPTGQMFSGETVTLRCVKQGRANTGWRYSWYKDGDSTRPVHSSDDKTDYSFSAVESDSGTYTCRGERRRDSQRSEISNTATLTVSARAYAVLRVSPQSWLTEGDSVTLSCKVRGSSTGWTFSWYRDNDELLSDSSRGAGGSYTLSPAALHHTGVYKCKATRGEKPYYTEYSIPQPLWITGSCPVSLMVNLCRTQLFTTDSLSLNCEGQNGSMILESPVHPVPKGDPLTLRCLYRYTNSSDLTAEFYKDGSLLQTQTTGEMTIRTVSKSDEGLYHCKHPERGESPQSWISVRGEEYITSSAESAGGLVEVAVGVSVPVLVIILLILWWCYKTNKGLITLSDSF